MREKIRNTMIELTVGKNQVLFIVLGKDGSINRSGTGSGDCKEKDLYIGLTQEKLFDKLIKKAKDEVFEYCGKSFDIPDKKGRECKLKILFNGEDLDTGFEFNYGELSQGPPNEVAEYVINAVKLTNPWYEEFKKGSNQEVSNEKRWWQFWK